MSESDASAVAPVLTLETRQSLAGMRFDQLDREEQIVQQAIALAVAQHTQTDFKRISDDQIIVPEENYRLILSKNAEELGLPEVPKAPFLHNFAPWNKNLGNLGVVLGNIKLLSVTMASFEKEIYEKVDKSEVSVKVVEKMKKALAELDEKILNADVEMLTHVDVYNAMISAKEAIAEIFDVVFPDSADDSYTRVPLYCHCRTAFSAFRAMIQCDSCKEWFHLDCEGISIPENKFADVYTYVCTLCDPIHQSKVVYKSFSTESYFNRISAGSSEKTPRPKASKPKPTKKDESAKVTKPRVTKKSEEGSIKEETAEKNVKTSRRKRSLPVQEDTEDEIDVEKEKAKGEQLQPIDPEDAAMFEKNGKKLKSLEAVVREGGVMKSKRTQKKPVLYEPEQRRKFVRQKGRSPAAKSKSEVQESAEKPAKRPRKRKSSGKSEAEHDADPVDDINEVVPSPTPSTPTE
jgi:hypothetical protein